MVRKLALILIISGLILVLTSQMYGTSELVEWKELDQASELAQKTDKPVFVYFHSETCAYCKLMSTTVFSDREVAQLLNEKFIPVKANVMVKEVVMRFAPVFQKNHVEFVTPSYIILDPEGRVIGMKAGYLDKEEFKSFILSFNKQ